MAEKNHNGDQESPQESTDIDLDLSLGRYFNEKRSTKEGNFSFMKRSIIEQSNTTTECELNDQRGVGVGDQIMQKCEPISSGFVWAAPSPSQNPALQQALNLVNFELSSKHALLISHAIEGGVSNSHILNSSFPSSSVPSNNPLGNAESNADSDPSQNEKSIIQYDFWAISSSSSFAESLVLEPKFGSATFPFSPLEDHAKDRPLMLTSPMNMIDFFAANATNKSDVLPNQNPISDYAKEIASSKSRIEQPVPIYDISSINRSFSDTLPNVEKNYIPVFPDPFPQGVCSNPFSRVSASQVQTSLPQSSRYASGLPPIPPRNPVATSSSRMDERVQPESQPAGKRVRTDENKMGIDLPMVMTDGGNPNGRVVEGFLCKYTEEEVLIVCACHNAVFTPKEFVMHAGGGEVENPNRLIKMAADL